LRGHSDTPLARAKLVGKSGADWDMMRGSLLLLLMVASRVWLAMGVVIDVGVVGDGFGYRRGHGW